jgi:hypothetical protein
MFKPSALLSAQLDKLTQQSFVNAEQVRRLANLTARLDVDLKRIASSDSLTSHSIESFLKRPESFTFSRLAKLELDRYKSVLESIQTSASSFARLEAVLLSSPSLDSQLLQAISPYSDLLKRFPLSSMEPAGDGHITVGAESIPTEVIRHAIQALPLDTHSPGELFTSLVAILAKLAPAAKAIFLYILLPYLVSAVAGLNAPLHEDLWQNLKGTSRPGAKAEVKSTVRARFPEIDLREHRFVTASTLNVRETGNSRAPVVAQLKFGKTVRLLDKGKHWSHVEFWVDEGENHQSGWVYSRYLEKFE